jgi:hypothetical protein
MNTIVISIEEAAQDLAAVIRRLRECGNCAVLVDTAGPLAEITPVLQSDAAGTDDGTPSSGTALSDEKPPERTEPRVGYSKLTGLPVITARPGERMVTSEEIYEELRGSFP